MSEYVKRGEEHESNNSKLTPSYSNIFLYFKWKTQITRMESPPKLLNVGEKRERELGRLAVFSRYPKGHTPKWSSLLKVIG